GTYSLSGESEDEVVALRMLGDDHPDKIILVADATRLEPSFVLLFQIMELGYPVILALNQMDLARRRFLLDVEALRRELGIPIVPISAKHGEGIEELADVMMSDGVTPPSFQVRYDAHIEDHLQELLPMVPPELPYPSRGAAIKLLEGNEHLSSLLPDDMREKAMSMAEEFQRKHGESIDVHINRDRYGEAGGILQLVQKPLEQGLSYRERISDITLRPLTGIPILIAVLGGLFLGIVLFGSLLDEFISGIYDNLVGDAIIAWGASIGGTLGETIATGIDQSITAILVLVIPYIVVFYIFMGVLEDSGYLPRAVVLLDGVMHRIGLHGRAVIPMMVGFGCSVPAILATRTAGTRRERLILATIIVMTVPCSAQMAIILGITARFAGLAYAALIFVVLLGLMLVLGRLMDRWLRYEPTYLAMEIPELSIPSIRNVAFKTWSRSKDFFLIAFPLLFVGSIGVEILVAYDALTFIIDPFTFLTVGLLGLPALTIISFIVGVIRKEMALGMLLTLFSVGAVSDLSVYLSPEQFFIFGLVMAIYLPCLATMAVLWREFGLRDTLLISLCSISLAFAVGSFFNLLLQVF
ncbi:MAG: ferrous iron transport protein B, partial [Candidatus Methanomethylophilaceae archaeon]